MLSNHSLLFPSSGLGLQQDYRVVVVCSGPDQLLKVQLHSGFNLYCLWRVHSSVLKYILHHHTHNVSISIPSVSA